MSIKYWKKSNGDCGTMDIDGFVPDSVEVSESIYMDFTNAQLAAKPDNKIVEYEDTVTGKILKLRKVK